jgi:hypothetical protein
LSSYGPRPARWVARLEEGVNIVLADGSLTDRRPPNGPGDKADPARRILNPRLRVVALARRAVSAAVELLVVLAVFFAGLVCFAMPVVGSVRRLGALPADELIAIRSIPGTSCLGCGRPAARRRHGQHRAVRASRGRYRRNGPGILHGKAEDYSDESSE